MPRTRLVDILMPITFTVGLATNMFAMYLEALLAAPFYLVLTTAGSMLAVTCTFILGMLNISRKELSLRPLEDKVIEMDRQLTDVGRRVSQILDQLVEIKRIVNVLEKGG